MEGIVIKSTGSWYTVRIPSGDLLNCRLKGKHRLDDIKSTNPVAVGDIVVLEPDEEVGTAVISVIKDRKNYIVRKASNLSKQSHILAANIDQAILVVTLNYPVTTRVFIDRFLASAEAYRIPVTIVINKIDRYNEALQNEMELFREVYERIDYPVVMLSAKMNENLAPLHDLLKDKVSMISGHSGVGKSTLINRVEPTLNIKTNEISSAHSTGKHTTTFAEMHPIAIGGYIIDTPGIRGFGLFDIENSELSHYFKEIFQHSSGCQYNNCSHLHEPGCAVKQAVQENNIAQSRYDSYVNILSNKEEKYR